METRSVRHLTQKGKALFEDKVKYHQTKIRRSEGNISKLLSLVQQPDFTYKPLDYIVKTQSLLHTVMHRFEIAADDFVAYLKSVSSLEAQAELSEFQILLSTLQRSVPLAFDIIGGLVEAKSKPPIELSADPEPASQLYVGQNVKSEFGPWTELPIQFFKGDKVSFNLPRIPKASKIPAQCERKSKSIRSSVSTYSILEQQAKADAAKVNLEFAKEEAKLLVQQAELDARHLILKKERLLREAEDELRLLCDELQLSDSGSSSSGSAIDNVSLLRAAQFVNNHKFNPVDNNNNKSDSEIPDLNFNHKPTPFVSQGNVKSNNPVPVSNFFEDFSKILLKKDLALNRLTMFDDRPEYYYVWKSAFKRVVTELGVSPSEEIDLLIKHLGPNSRQHAISIRAANMNNPRLGVERIWERLDDRFASPELVESLIKKKLVNFPKISLKEPGKLFDLVDIVSEIESLKSDHLYSKLLSHFDSSAGVNPIVSKLPYNLQEKWTSCATEYKEKYQVIFPPFSVFSRFLRKIAKIRNDPSFVYDNPPHKASNIPEFQVESTSSKSFKYATVKKTEALPAFPSQSTEKTRHCPFHNCNSHNLNFCNNFRSLPLFERKKFLADHDICVKCCRNSHSTDQCDVSVFCGLCKESTHPAALHVYSDASSSVVTHRPGEHNNNNNFVATPHLSLEGSHLL